MSAATTTTLGPATPLAALSYIPEGPPPWAPRPELAEAQAALTDDGDVFDLGNGWSLRLSIEVDEGYSVNDYDGDGRVEWTHPGQYDYSGHAPRPEGFDGAARVLMRDGSSCLWWQPPGREITGATWDAETLDAEAARVRDLCEYGFRYVSLTLLQTVTDARGGEHEVEVAREGLGGVDAVYPELIAEMAGELDYAEAAS